MLSASAASMPSRCISRARCTSARHVDHQDPVEPRIGGARTALGQQRNRDHRVRRRPRPRRRHAARRGSADGGSLRAGAARRRRRTRVARIAARSRRPSALQDVGAERRDDLRQRRLAGLDDGARGHVGVGDRHAQGDEAAATALLPEATPPVTADDEVTHAVATSRGEVSSGRTAAGSHRPAVGPRRMRSSRRWPGRGRTGSASRGRGPSRPARSSR